MTPVFLPPACPHTTAQPANQPEEKGERKCRPLARRGNAPAPRVAVTGKQRGLARPGQVPSTLPEPSRAPFRVFSAEV